MDIDIRIARKEDAANLEEFFVQNENPQYLNIMKAYIRSAFSSDFRRPVFVIALEDNKIIGSGTFSEELFTVETWGLSGLLVEQEKRNQGLGQKLIEARLDYIRQIAQKTVTVILNTYPGKTVLFERLGFEKAGQDHSGGWYMIKTLPAFD